MTRLLPIALALFALPLASHGAGITFASPVSIAGESDVATAGTLKFAYNWANAPQTVNGVVFAGTNATTTVGTDLSMTWLGGGRSNLTAFSGSGVFTGLTAAYQGMLKGAVYAATSGAGTTSTITLTGLIVGHSYLIQFWVNDARGGNAGGNRSETITSGANTVTPVYGGSTVGTPGQYVIGTFIADATSQSLALTTTATGNLPTAQMNAIQVRDTTDLGNLGYLWDPNGNTAGIGGTGAWNTTSAAWTTNSAGTSGSSVYPNAGGLANSVGFIGTPGTVTVASHTAINVSAITFVSSGYTIAGADSTATLTNSTGAGQLTVATGAGNSQTISAVITGPIILEKANDSGTLILSGANTYTGGTIILGGTVSLRGQLPAGLQIMPMGDSITYGGSGSNGGYRGYLRALLAPVAPGFQFAGVSTVNPGSLPTSPLNQTHHNGYSSYSSVHLSNNLDGLDTQPYTTYGGASRDPLGGYWLVGGNGTGRSPAFPDIVLLLVGANDIFWNTAQINVANYPANLTALINKILTLSSGTRVLVADITPWPARSANVVTINNGVKSVVAAFRAQGKAVSEVDLNTNFPVDGLSADGLHPNDTGYAWMANQWYASIIATASTSGAATGIPANSDVSVAAGATLALNGQSLTLDALTGAGTVSTGGGALSIGNAGGSFPFGGTISGTGSLLKAGVGTITLGGAHTYTGTTNVTSGNLLVNGSLTTSATTVQPTATLSGTGTLGAVTVIAGAALAPGGPNIGTLRTGSTVLAGTYACDLDGTTSDRLAVTGNLNLTGAVLVLSNHAGVPVSSNQTIATYTGTLTGGFASVTPGYSVIQDTANKRILVSPNTYELWVASHHLSGSDALTTADPDQDGIPNLIEHVIGGNPEQVADTALLPTAVPVHVDGTDYLKFTYRRTRDSADAGVTTECQYGTDTSSWTTAINGIDGVILTSTPDGFGSNPSAHKVEVLIPRDLATNSSLFCRLRAVLP
jgi:autotransporter-associated beta strand protein